MHPAIKIGLALELLATCAHAAVPILHGILPLTGSDIGQLGFALTVSVAYTEIASVMGKKDGEEGASKH